MIRGFSERNDLGGEAIVIAHSPWINSPILKIDGMLDF